jgi:hypothetical protein
MAEYATRFGALGDFHKGHVDVIDDDPKNYAFSNVYEVASRSAPFEKIAVAQNLEYVLEAIRVEGTGGWRTCAHDEFALVMDGEVTFEFRDLDAGAVDRPEHGSVAIAGEPDAPAMGSVVARRGHMTLLPAGAAYRYSAEPAAVVLLQTIAGADTVYRWSEICQTVG